jgi:nitroreductase
MRMPWFRKFPEVLPAPQYRDAPVIIVICGDPRTAQATTLDRVYDYRWVVLENICMTTQILHLAVAACGLRSQFVTVNFLTEQLIKPILGIPPIIRIFSLAPIGYPVHEPPRSYRRELKEFVHFDKYDMSKYRSHQDVQEFIRQLRKRSESAYPLLRR